MLRLPVRPLLLIMLALLGLTWLAYAAGLHGSFLFDDFGNLPALGASGPVDSWPTFWRYVTSGNADPTGRPLALLSFLLDAHNWPANPYPFKRTNLVLHLVNGVLLVLLLQQLGKLAFGQDTDAPHGRIDMAAVVGAALWMLHPLFVSTTLYIVQREAMLPTTFALLGLLIWLRGRCAMLDGRTIVGLVWIVLGLGGCTALAMLSKANGILLPALALVVEYVMLRPSLSRPPTLAKQRLPVAYRQVLIVFSWFPTILVAGYLLSSAWNGFVHGVSELRPWTMGQRLLTESRVLMQYLDLLWLPRPYTPGLFNDQIQTSTALLMPWTTLPSVLGVLGLITSAWLLRRRWPAIALAILFYFVGQSLESSTIPLELYFEHRNYLPATLMFWPLALWLCGVVQLRQHPVARSPADVARSSQLSLASQQTDLAKAVLAILVLAGMALMTHVRAQLWGNTNEQGRLWATINPDSPRAQANAALLSMTARNPQAAAIRLQALLRHQPDQVQLALNLLGAHCMLGKLAPQDLSQARYAMARTRDPGSLLTHWFEPAIEEAQSGKCRGLTLSSLQSLLDAGLTNSMLAKVSGRRQDLLYLQGRIALARHEPTEALADFNEALDQNVRPTVALEQAAQLGANGYPREGLTHLEHYERVQDRQARPGLGMPWLHAWVLRHQHYWPKEITRLRDTLRIDAAAQPASTQ